MLVSTHNLGSVPEFCDRTILIKGTVLAYGKTSEVFTQENLERTTDDERPFVIYDKKEGSE